MITIIDINRYLPEETREDIIKRINDTGNMPILSLTDKLFTIECAIETKWVVTSLDDCGTFIATKNKYIIHGNLNSFVKANDLSSFRNFICIMIQYKYIILENLSRNIGAISYYMSRVKPGTYTTMSSQRYLSDIEIQYILLYLCQTDVDWGSVVEHCKNKGFWRNDIISIKYDGRYFTYNINNNDKVSASDLENWIVRVDGIKIIIRCPKHLKMFILPESCEIKSQNSMLIDEWYNNVLKPIIGFSIDAAIIDGAGNIVNGHNLTIGDVRISY